MCEIQNDKPFMTYEQLIDKLKNDKRLNIKDDKYAIKLLKKHSYFALISGYKGMFKSQDGNYKIRTSIEDIYALYVFDDSLRALFLRYILKIEKHVKSLISYSFCETFGENQFYYLREIGYSNTPDKQEDVSKMLSKLFGIINNPSEYVYIRHQKDKHGNVPLWVLMKALTLGTVSKMFSLLSQCLQQKVSKEFAHVHESMMIRMLDLLARVRNVCAHNERLYDYKYKKGAIHDTYVHHKLNMKRKKGQYKAGKSDLFAVVITLKYLLDENEFSDFMEELSALFGKLFYETKQIHQSQLYAAMGFPENWKDIKDCKLKKC